MKLSEIKAADESVKMQDIVKHLGEFEVDPAEEITDTTAKDIFITYHEHDAYVDLTLKGGKMEMVITNDRAEDASDKVYKRSFDIAGMSAQLIGSSIEDEIDHYLHNLPSEDEDDEDYDD